MAAVVLAFGPAVVFGSRTLPPVAMRRSAEYRWTRHPRVGSRPSLSFVGVGPETLTLDVVQVPGYGLAAAVDALRAVAATGAPHILADADGRPYGWWVVTGVSDGGSPLDGAGRPLSRQVRVTFERFDESVLTLARRTGRRILDAVTG